jgi:hypothetical protein
MFRNTQLLRRSSQIGANEGEQDSRPVAILAHPYEAEAGILVPVLARFGFRVLEARDGAAALDLARRHVTSLVVASTDMPQISGAPFILISSPLNLAEFESELNGVLQSPPAAKPAPSEPLLPTTRITNRFCRRISESKTGEGPRGSRDVNDIMSLTDDEGWA